MNRTLRAVAEIPPRKNTLAAEIPHSAFQAIPGMGHSLFSPGLPRQIGAIVREHLTQRKKRNGRPGESRPPAGQAFFTTLDFSCIAPNPSILQSMS